MRKGHPYGLHRVLDPPGAMPQPAWKLDNQPVCYDNELLIDVERLSIDAASFTQIRMEANDNPERVAAIMRRIVEERGKHHNPVTGSGGMLVGRVAEIGSALSTRVDVAVGERIATLVSLSLTPLYLEDIVDIQMASGQVTVRGKAVLFETGIFAKLPEDIPEAVALAVLDVCGASAQTARIVQPGQHVVVLGAGGKSGLTVLCQARRSAGNGRVVAVETSPEGQARIAQLGCADAVLAVDATLPLEVMAAVEEALGGHLADVVINCVNVPNTELSSILCAKEHGLVYFFSMATNFAAAALGAEGVAKDVELHIGNGYCRGHADHAIHLLRTTPELLRIFEEKVAASRTKDAEHLSTTLKEAAK
ncbi:L-erythro-3,5-diaminohexanoate dehydrogenase [Alicyclobacillus contaminans]|uniref:L-erythro-3,5-diaminohexanoate dehydrogenase n=1 Tax=Alicyclobacillus contaminans TaxID=392016 RepID=UPI00040FBEF7|nr:zinc-binding dehydrogenase [Alicyclobacillus contaminans]GMA50866.1 L-erythro-3,5-diaminohexanoate dehydrogenase [Alicyclobacillus contaminans]